MKPTLTILGLLLALVVTGQEYFPENTVFTFDSETLPDYIQPIQHSKGEQTWFIETDVPEVDRFYIPDQYYWMNGRWNVQTAHWITKEDDGSYYFSGGKRRDSTGQIRNSGLSIRLRYNPSAWMALSIRYKTSHSSPNLIYSVRNITQEPSQDWIGYRKSYAGLWARDYFINLTLYGRRLNHSWSSGDIIQIDIYVGHDDPEPENELLIDDIVYTTVSNQHDGRRAIHLPSVGYYSQIPDPVPYVKTSHDSLRPTPLIFRP